MYLNLKSYRYTREIDYQNLKSSFDLYDYLISDRNSYTGYSLFHNNEI